MRRHRAISASMVTTALLGLAVAAAAAEAPPPVADDRAQLRRLHFEYGLVVACGLVDDEIEAGYRLRADVLEQRLGIEDDAEARYRQLNLGWTEADADWAARGDRTFRDRCRGDAPAAGERFRGAFRDTGETLEPRPKGSKR